MRFWKVGELAERTGVTVRTLHHYEEIGLLVPSQRSPAGYRLYAAAELSRLQQILSLRALGFPLEEIGRCLADPSFSPLRVVEMHLARVREEAAERQRLCDRLEALATHLRSGGAVSPEEFLQTMEMITMYEKYYTPEQLKELEARRASLGEARIREVEAEWPRLMEEVRAEMERGTDPSDPRVRALAERWSALVAEFTGGNPGIAASLEELHRNEPEVQGMPTGPLREMAAYLFAGR